MTMTRRRFSQGALTAAALLALGAPRTGHGAATDGRRRAAHHELKTFHFHLPNLHPDGKHVLRVGGRRYRVQAHTAATRQRARRSRPGLAHLLDAHLTHFAENVRVSTDGVQRMHVTTADPVRGHGLALVAMHIPSAARRRARGARNISRLGTSSLECALEDQVEDDYLTATSAAKALITHHPDLCSTDPDTAAAIEAHMDGDQAAAVENLALSICFQGGAYEHDPAWLDGWCVLVPMTNSDGSPLLDSTGEQVFDYQFSDQTSVDMQPAIEAVLAAVKNDPILNGEQYDLIYHGDPVDEAALPPASPPVLGDDTTALAVRSSLGSSSGESVTLGTKGYHHNVLFYDVSHSSTDRSVTLKILNLNFIWYGLYLEYLDPNGVPLASPHRSSVLQPLRDVAIDLETDTLKFWDLVSAPAAIFGLPVPFPYQISVSLPDGASQVRFNLIGPGSYGPVGYGPSLVPGTVLTALLSYAVPIKFMVKGAGLDENKTLIDLFTQKSVIVKTLLFFAQLYYAITGTGTNDLGAAGSLTSLVAGLAQDMAVMNIKSSIPELWAWITAKLSEEEAEESVPFVGWVIRVMALLGATAQITATSAEIATNPLVISNTVSFTHSVTVVASHDPTDFEFPLIATRFEVTLTVSGKALDPVVVPISDEERSNETLAAVVPNVPSTGAPATVSVVFKADNGYPIAYSAAVDTNGVPVLDDNGNRIPGEITFLNKLPSSGELIVQVPIVENPVPITAQTLYTHHHRLQYAGGKYLWNYTSQKPAIEAASCGTSSGLCDLGNVTIWLPGGMVGYSWLASSPSIHDCRTGATGQLYNFQNVSLKNDPNPARKTPGCGFPGLTPLAYDAAVPVGEPGNHFYLDPVKISDLDPEYHLRRLVLDTTTPINVQTNQSWGRFRIQIDRLALYGKGHPPMVVGISTRNHKFAVLEIPNAPYVGDDFANNAKVMSGPGESNDGLLLNPVAVTVADSGAILILQGGATKSVKAFDFDGKPWKLFANGTSSVLRLPQDAATVTWLDITVDPTNLLYVLSCTGGGTQASDYRLDVYDSNAGTRVVRNTGVGVARIVVDKFRGLYSLNRETVKGSPVVEPSVSVWAPSPPPAAALALPHVTLSAVIRDVRALPLSEGLRHALLASLERVRQELSRGNRRGVEAHVHAFLQKVAMLRGRYLSAPEIEALVARGEDLLAAL